MNQIGVMHLIDTLDIGGAEKVAVNVVNHLPRTQFEPHLCSTRHDGVLAESVDANVQRLRLRRKGRFDIKAVRRLERYILWHDIKILHAHSTSLFIAILTSLWSPNPAVIWHVHSGKYAVQGKRTWLYRLATRRVRGVIAVNQALVEWSQIKLKIPSDRVRYVPNFVYIPDSDGKVLELPGCAGSRIVCVANLRPEKGLLSLLRAMKIVISRFPQAQLLIIGSAKDPEYFAFIKENIVQLGLYSYITLMGKRNDVAAILRHCDIGVLSSISEGLPLAVLEYGAVGLPVVSTSVGQCSEVLDNGRAGLLVPPEDTQALANALSSLLESPTLRSRLGDRLNTRVQTDYSMDSAIEQICQVYMQALTER